jgi:LPS sulfotransferase NodH
MTHAIGKAARMDSYLICATPRTGSSLLCGLLASTEVAGRPESYFRQPDEPSWASQWGIARADGTFAYAGYVERALAAGRTRNGVFAARLMWGTLEELTAKLRARYRDPGARDIEVVTRALGRTRFVHLHRVDVVAQAVSWLRAEQTDVWVETIESEAVAQGQELQFDLGALDEFCRTINEHNAGWQHWFASAGIEPYSVTYEDLDRDPVGVTRSVLDFLDLELPQRGLVQVRNRRQADRLSAEWIKRHRSARTHDRRVARRGSARFTGSTAS